MTTSELIAGYAGPLLIVVAAAMLLRRSVFADVIQDLSNSRGLIVLAGVLALIAGLAIVRAHNVWAADWTVAVTVLGWLCILGGVLRIVWPDRIAGLADSMMGGNAAYTSWALFTLALGAFFTAKGYALV